MNTPKIEGNKARGILIGIEEYNLLITAQQTVLDSTGKRPSLSKLVRHAIKQTYVVQ